MFNRWIGRIRWDSDLMIAVVDKKTDIWWCEFVSCCLSDVNLVDIKGEMNDMERELDKETKIR